VSHTGSVRPRGGSSEQADWRPATMFSP
jgi:hypothetical protein